jgi:hypothetical protein
LHRTLFNPPAVKTLQPDLRAPASASTFRASEIGPSVRGFTSSRLSAYPEKCHCGRVLPLWRVFL